MAAGTRFFFVLQQGGTAFFVREPMDASCERALLVGVDIFADLDERAVEDVLRAAHRRKVAKGETAFRQDEEAGAFYVLTAGRLKVTQVTAEGQQVVVRFIGPGEMFGCVAVFGGRCYPGTATAVEECRMIGFTKATMQHLMERHPRLAINTMGTIGGRLQETQARLRELSTERVERRIAHALIRLAEQAGRPVASGIVFDFAISRQDVAEMSGTTLHTVSRTLSAWEAQGIVEGGRQKITIRKPDALLAIAEDQPSPAR
jgi:CRP/FNR family transcriptional regulator, nitrogen oxide reductase regulator